MKPLSHSSYLRLQILCQSFWDVDEKLCSLNDLSLADLKAFIPKVLSQVCMYMGILNFCIRSTALNSSDQIIPFSYQLYS